MAEPSIVVIPGDRGSAEKRWGTEQFLAALDRPCLCLDLEALPYSPRAVRRLVEQTGERTLTVIAFSAGVVGAVAALQPGWLQKRDIHIGALIALDGWLVPLIGLPFPVFRMSHDSFTHRTCLPFGMGTTNFYADPAVPHLDLWAQPALVAGWQVGGGPRLSTTALAFLKDRLSQPLP